MKKLLISTAAIALLLGSASADPGDQGNKRHDRATQGEARGQNGKNDTAPQGEARGQNGQNGRDDSNFVKANDQKTNNNRNADRNVTTNSNMNGDRRTTDAQQQRRSVNRAMNAQRNFDVAQYRHNMRSAHRFRTSRYMGPQGYSYRRWSYGQRLPNMYYARNYWLSDFLAFGLFAPPSGYTWVRYGDDALLVDRYTGEIIQVRYDVFWS